MIIRFSDRERTKVEAEGIEGRVENLRDSKKKIKLQRDRYVEKVTHTHQPCNDQLLYGLHLNDFAVMIHRL
jgi:uncharacterized protein YPO0396